jgi:secondary thiamine-phosphate synthase enzyme
VTDLRFNTTQMIEAIDVSDRVLAIDLPDGFAWLQSPHTTAALFISESDPEMLRDIERVARELFHPYEPFAHHKNNKPNAAAHLFSSLMGGQLLLPVVDGHIRLQGYQRLVFLELDGPRSGRTIQVAPMSPPPAAGVRA